MTLGVGMNIDLDLERLAKLIAVVSDGTRPVATALGHHKSMIASLGSWARHLGLVERTDQVTDLGRRLALRDASLQRHETRLILYHQLASNPSAELFYYLVNHFLYDAYVAGRSFDTQDIRLAAAHAGVAAHSNASKQRDREVALMLNALKRPQAFGPLDMVSREAKGQYAVHPPKLVPAFVAYVVYRDWPGESATLRFDELEMPGRLARTCLLSRPSLVAALRAAERSGYLQVEEEAQFDRVRKRPEWDSARLQEALYAGRSQ